MENTIIVKGRVLNPQELPKLNKFGLSVYSGKLPSGQYPKGIIYNVVDFEKTTIVKGSQVIVEGYFQATEYNGVERIDLIAKSIKLIGQSQAPKSFDDLPF
jgi:hypothetical protein